MGKSTAGGLVEFIAAEMHRQGYEQNELADRAGIGHSTLSRILRGISLPEMESIDKIARALGYGLIPFLMIAAQSISGFQDTDLMERFQCLDSGGRIMVLEFVRMIEGRSGREIGRP